MSGCTMGAVTQLELNDVQMQFLWIRQNSVYQLTDSGWEAINGFLDPLDTRVTEGLVVIDFSVMLEPTIADWDTLLPLIGFSEGTTDTFTLTQTIPSFTTVMNLGPKYHSYATCYVDRAVVRHSRGEHPQRLELRIFGTSETLADSDPGISTLAEGVGYPFHQVVCTVQGGAEAIDRYSIGIDNKIHREWNNSRTLSGACPGGRQIYLGISTPYTNDEEALYSVPAGGTLSTTGGSIAYTRGNFSQTWTFEHLQLLASPPDVLGKNDEVRLDQFYRAYRSVSAAALVVTQDATA